MSTGATHISRHHPAEDAIIRALQAGHSYKEVGEFYDVPDMTIWRIKKRAGMAVKSKAQKPRPLLPELFRSYQAQKAEVEIVSHDWLSRGLELLYKWAAERPQGFTSNEVRQQLQFQLTEIDKPCHWNMLIARAAQQQLIEHAGYKPIDGKAESIWRPRQAA